MKICTKCGLNPRHSTLYICRECRIDYNNLNKNSIKEYNKTRYDNNKDVILEKIRIYHNLNKEDIKIYTKGWQQNNKEWINNYSSERYKNDIEFKLKLNLRNTLKNKIKAVGARKYKSSLKLTGCSIIDLKHHLESLFLPEMCWENHGYIWEIDHIIPCSRFNLLLEEEQQKCFHYSNLQPLFKTTEIAESFGYENYIGNRNKYNN